MAEAKYIEFFGGWVAFQSGKAVRTRDRGIKVFKTEAEALKAARASRIGRSKRFGKPLIDIL